MIIEQTKDEIIFKLPANLNIEELQEMADLLGVKEISQKSKATQKEVDELAKVAKKGRWKRTRAKLGL